jgi:hypothetical protein
MMMSVRRTSLMGVVAGKKQKWLMVVDVDVAAGVDGLSELVRESL